MAVPRWAKIAIAFTGVMIVATVVMIILLATAFYWWLVVNAGYFPRNSKKVVALMEKKFVIDFPDEIQQTKTAVGASWDNWTTVLIRFVAEPNTVQAFLDSVPASHLDSYSPGVSQDGRTKIRPIPKWFTIPIRTGKGGNFKCKPRIEEEPDSEGIIYIDTSDQEANIVYICVDFGGSF